MDLLQRYLRWFTSDPDNTNSGDLDNIMATNPLRSPRTETVRQLAAILQESRVIHVRGTPASGKTTLAALLTEHCLESNIPVVTFCRPKFSPSEDYRTLIIQEARGLGYTHFDHAFVSDGEYVLIIDDGHTTFSDEQLWYCLVKKQSLSPTGPQICILTSYGSPLFGLDDITLGSPPALLGAQQRVSITPSLLRFSPKISLFYNHNEFEDVVDKFCSPDHQYRTPLLRLDKSARKYIFDLTSGHPGAVDGVLSMLVQFYHSELKHTGLILSSDHIIDTLDDERNAFTSVIPQSAGLFRYRNTPPLRRFVENYWTSTTQDFPIDRFPTLDKLCQQILLSFSPRNFTNAVRIGTAAMVKPYEAAFQDEFYRASHQVLGYAMNVTSEWSSGGRGRIDFRFAQVQWGVELLCNGDRLNEHCDRFSPGGTYWPWIANGSLKDWLIIDCRTTPPCPKPNGKNSQNFGEQFLLLTLALCKC
ncbi:hypothetical protein N7495_004353 [Penicillium taxi]|uniref:uncharacterized protein n=1 Tax=Penicillium taxi TaxID=168475 RepID=UPI00254584EF|nr:uncharacterized protein N7495_004353 [Penicillium taxi]KAJ5899609.1 hypothetical protein N7495_004353 [Penicillium taxi]